MSAAADNAWPTPRSTVLDVIYQHRRTEAVFKDYERQTGRCICCQSLFDTLEATAAAHGLDLAELLERLRAVITAEEFGG